MKNSETEAKQPMKKSGTTLKSSAKKTGTAAKKTTRKREQNKEQTQERILNAALELFHKKGFFKTTTKEISQKASIAEGTLFNYFKTKEDLALYFFGRELENCIDWYYQDKYIQTAPLPEKLFAITQHSLDAAWLLMKSLLERSISVLFNHDPNCIR